MLTCFIICNINSLLSGNGRHCRNISYLFTIANHKVWVVILVGTDSYFFSINGNTIISQVIVIKVALGKSKKLMKGHYAELIKLDVSNMGWFLLMIFTAGIAGFYVIPYTSIVYAEFYDYLKAQEEFLN